MHLFNYTLIQWYNDTRGWMYEEKLYYINWRIFNKKYPYNYENNEKIDEVLQAIKEANYEIDVNTAGLRKPYCGEVYPSGYFFNKAKELEIDMVFGSDSHKAEDIAANFNKDL